MIISSCQCLCALSFQPFAQRRLFAVRNSESMPFVKRDFWFSLIHQTVANAHTHLHTHNTHIHTCTHIRTHTPMHTRTHIHAQRLDFVCILGCLLLGVD